MWKKLLAERNEDDYFYCASLTRSHTVLLGVPVEFSLNVFMFSTGRGGGRVVMAMEREESRFAPYFSNCFFIRS